MAHSGLALAVTFNSNWDFGNVIIGSSNEYVLTVSNDSLSMDSGYLYINGPFWLLDGSKLTQQMYLKISPLSKRKINVRFTPTSSGNYQANVTYKYQFCIGADMFNCDPGSDQSKDAGPFKGIGIGYDIAPALNLLLD
jgi:hypothetical protein